MSRDTEQRDALDSYLTYAPRSYGLPWELVREHRFHEVRRFRFDYAWIAPKIAIEYDGVMKRTVGHNSLSGILRDQEKSNLAQSCGWQVYRANAKNVADGSFMTLIDGVLLAHKEAA